MPTDDVTTTEVSRVLALLNRQEQEIKTLAGPLPAGRLAERIEIALQGVVDAIHDAHLLISTHPGPDG